MDCGVNHGDGTSINKTSKSPDYLIDSVYMSGNSDSTNVFVALKCV